MRRLFGLIWFGVIGAVSPAFADGFIIVDEAQWLHHLAPPVIIQPHPRPPWPGPPPRPYIFAPLEIVYHHVNVRIDGQVATTTVDQEFYNPNDFRLEGTYLFPIPRGAHIDKFSMDIAGRQVEAELLSA